MTKEKVAEMLEYAENMAEKCREKDNQRGYDWWMGKVSAYQNISELF